MIEKQIRALTPTKLRLILFSTMGALIIISCVGFWLFHEQMVPYASQISADNATANASNDDIATLQRLETQLKDNEVAVTRAKSIVADSKSYQYQVQIINDIKAYAAKAGVEVTSYTFGDGSTTAPAGTPPAQQPTSASTVAPTVAGLNTTSVSINVKSPVDYTAYMTFLRSIELNLTKMEINGVSISKAGEKPNEVQVSPLNIEVYTR